MVTRAALLSCDPVQVRTTTPPQPRIGLPSKLALAGAALLTGLVAAGRTPATMLLPAGALLVADLLVNARRAPVDGLDPNGWRESGNLILWQDMIELLISGSPTRPVEIHYRHGDRERRLVLQLSEAQEEKLVIRARFNHVLVRHFTG